MIDFNLNETKPNNLIYIKVKINNRDIISLIDTGSEISIIDSTLSQKLSCETIPYSGPILKAANDTKIEVLGKTYLDLSFPGCEKNYILSPIVVKDFKHQMLLGNNFNIKAGAQIDCESKSISFKDFENTLTVNMIQPIRSLNGTESIHSNQTIILRQNQKYELKVSAAHWRKNPSFVGIVMTDKKIFNNEAISIEQGRFTFEKGTTIIPIIYHGNKSQLIKTGQPVGKVFKYKISQKGTNFENNHVQIINEPEYFINNLFGGNDELEESKLKKETKILPYDPNQILSEKLAQNEIDINPELTTEQRTQIERILYEFSDIFSFDSRNIGLCRVLEHFIDTGARGPVYTPPYRYSAYQREIINDQVKEWVEMGIVTPICSDYGSPVVLVKKKEIDPKTGLNQLRICVDLRKLNEITTADHYPLPRISDALDSLAGCEYFSALDLNSGYLQILVNNDQP